MIDGGTILKSLLTLALAAALAACSSKNAAEAEDAQPERELGSYEIDGQTGEIRARVTQEDGSVATMRSGESVPVAFPEGFTVYPGAEIITNTVVRNAQGEMMVIAMESDALPAAIVEFYREQASAANITIGLDLSAGGAEMLAGEGTDGLTFSLSASRETDRTIINLTIGDEGG